MAHPALSSDGQPICTWSDASRNFAIYLRPGVMGRLGTESWVAFKRLPRRGLEIGGILLGQIDRAQNTTTFWIEGFAAVESEHQSGPSYVLSEPDLGHLQDEISKNGAASIGIFRSQTRSEQLDIQEPDVALLERCFGPTDAVFLIVSPVLRKAALFIQANGNVRCVHEFPLASLSAVLKGGKAIPSQEAVAPSNPHPEIRNAVTRVVRQLEALKNTDTSVSDQPLDHPPASLPSSPRESPLDPPENRNIGFLVTSPIVQWARGFKVKREHQILAAALLAAVVVTGIVTVRFYAAPRSVTRSAAPAAPATSAVEYIQMGVERAGSSLRVHWDRNSPALRGATRAILHIEDGENQIDRIVTPLELSTGSVDYEPKNSELVFRLEVYSAEPRATGLVQVVNLPTQLAIRKTRPAQPVIESEPKRATNAVPPAPTSPAPVEPVMAQPVAKIEENSEILPGAFKPGDGVRAGPPVTPESSDEIETKTSDTLDFPTPKVPEKPTQPIATAPGRATPVSQGGPSVSVLAEPVSGSTFGRVIGKVPLLRLLRSHDDVVEPVPVYQAQPILELPGQQHITQAVSVNVKVDVAESGKVTAAEIIEYGDPPNFSLANAALAAAREWTFQPARAEDLPVSSQVILHFRFSP